MKPQGQSPQDLLSAVSALLRELQGRRRVPGLQLSTTQAGANLGLRYAPCVRSTPGYRMPGFQPSRARSRCRSDTNRDFAFRPLRRGERGDEVVSDARRPADMDAEEVTRHVR